MLLSSVLVGVALATASQASPMERDPKSLHEEIVHFKRDSVISARDLELAEMHQVNLTEMYKHSVIKRHDGEEVTIWVDNGYEVAEGPEEDSLSKRQSARLWMGSQFLKSGLVDYCRNHDRRDITSSSSPFTGGVHAIASWARNNDGFFPWGDDHRGWGWRTILIGGSNAGRNARYRAAVDRKAIGQTRVGLGTHDVRDDADWTRARQRQYNGKWRAASYGWQTCGIPGGGWGRVNYEIVSFDQNV